MADNVKSGPQLNKATPKPRAVDPASQHQAGLEQVDLQGMQQAAINPGLATPDDILNLQSDYGNRTVSRLLIKASGQAPSVVQTKLKVGPVNDQYEQEANRVADQVMRASADQATPSNKARKQHRESARAGDEGY